jgi:CTP:molybdopterin cytidylyltransferase MocA
VIATWVARASVVSAVVAAGGGGSRLRLRLRPSRLLVSRERERCLAWRCFDILSSFACSGCIACLTARARSAAASGGGDAAAALWRSAATGLGEGEGDSSASRRAALVGIPAGLGLLLLLTGVVGSACAACCGVVR